LRRVFIVAPNVGLSFGGGGGVKVALYMAQTLLEHGLKVHLVALSGWYIEELDRVHGTNLRRFYREGKIVLNYLFGYGDSPRIPFPIATSIIASYIRRSVREHLPDLLIFHDDVPRLSEEVFKNVLKIVLYSHFPYAARIRFNVVDAVEVGLERYQSYKTRLYYVTLKRVVYHNDMPKEVELVANSTVTKVFMELLWKRNVKVLYPPITFQPKPLERLKNNSVILVGGQPNKRIGDAIKALAELRDRGRLTPKLYVVAYHFVPWYREWLTNLVHRLGLQQYVHFMEELPERDLLNLYASSKIILSTAHFEPFGMSVAEGMALRAVPVVYKGSLSGPWIDIVDKGKYGIGFRTIEELAETIEYIMDVDRAELSELQERTYIGFSRFLFDKFEKNIARLLESLK
jgi:glycosyltransferase involved in cell wall biosynthesis